VYNYDIRNHLLLFSDCGEDAICEFSKAEFYTSGFNPALKDDFIIVFKPGPIYPIAPDNLFARLTAF